MSEAHHDIPQDLFDTLERYYMAEMTEAEKAAFEKQLNIDGSLRDHLEQYRDLVKGIELGALKDEMEDFHQAISSGLSNELDESTPIHRKWPAIRYLTAASLLLTAVIGGLWFFNQSDSSEALFATYFKPDPGLITVMGGDENYEFSNAMVSYKQGDYATAIEKWETLLYEKPKNDTLDYFLGVSYLALGNENEAIRYLSSPTQFLNSAFQSEAFYYLGLAYLKAGDLEDAKNNLSQSKMENSQLIISKIKE